VRACGAAGAAAAVPVTVVIMLLRGGARGPAGRAGSGSGCERRPVNRSHTAYNATRLLHFWGMQDALPGRTVAGVMGHGWVSTTRWWFHPDALRAQRHPASAAPSPRPRRHHSQFQRRSTHGGLGGSARQRRGDVRFLEAGFRPTREGRRIGSWRYRRLRRSRPASRWWWHPRRTTRRCRPLPGQPNVIP